jgi:prophage DNA circulation protein
MVKKLTFAVLAFSWLCAFKTPKGIAQDKTSQSAVTTDNSADAFLDLHMALLRKDIHSIKKDFISTNLTLTEGEATQFWPLYEQYSATFDKITAMRAALVEEYANEYGTMTEEQADSLVRRWLDTDIEAAQLRQKYVPIVRKVLPARKAATFFQLDRRISMMIDVQLTSQLALVQSQD